MVKPIHLYILLLLKVIPKCHALKACDASQTGWCSYFILVAGRTCTADICERYATSEPSKVIDCTDMTSYTCDTFLQSNGASCTSRTSLTTDILCNGQPIPRPEKTFWR
ncbi:hypothetical protein BC941DRAFT_444361, partial [Chlamydoabsidia padenii]